MFRANLIDAATVQGQLDTNRSGVNKIKKSNLKVRMRSFVMQVKRGALIVVEGCDRVGKTTQCKKLVERLKTQKVDVKFMNFPNRSTETGEMLDAYLRKKDNLNNEGIHLLFAVNRWEARNEMEKTLKAGTSIICDRYSYSGVAYSTAKGLDFEWCKVAEKGLIKPDLVIYLTLSEETRAVRGGFGEERFDSTEMQKKVNKAFEKMMEAPLWQVIDADKTEDKLGDELERLVLGKLQSIDEKIQTLW